MKNKLETACVFVKVSSDRNFAQLLSFPEPTWPSVGDRDEQMRMRWFVVSGTHLHSADTSCSHSCLP